MPQSAGGDGAGREENFILAPLPDEEYAQLEPSLEPVQYEVKESLYQAGETIGPPCR